MPTYTVAELGEMLPVRIGESNYGSFKAGKAKVMYSCRYNDLVNFMELKEANARAKLLIWLIENNHVNVEDLNDAE